MVNVSTTNQHSCCGYGPGDNPTDKSGSEHFLTIIAGMSAPHFHHTTSQAAYLLTKKQQQKQNDVNNNVNNNSRLKFHCTKLLSLPRVCLVLPTI